MSEHRGYSISGVGSLHVGRLPERKSPAIYVVRNGEVRAVGYFRSAEDAEEVREMLDTLANGYNMKPDEEAP